MIVKMIQDLGKRMEAKIEKMQEMFTKDLEELKKKQTEMNNTLEGINSRITEAGKKKNNWGRRMDKWLGGQNGRNHCHRT